MAVFSRILDFKRDFLARLRNKRAQPRHRVGVDFPLRASLCLLGTELPFPGHASERGRGRSWGGSVGDLSVNGLSLLLSPAAVTARGEPTFVRLTLEDLELVIPCTVAHFRVHGSHAKCGVLLEFGDFKIQQAFHQVVEAVKLGASFSPTGPGRKQAGLVRRSWRSTGGTRLTEWREPTSDALVRFELNLAGHAVQGQSFVPGLAVTPRGDPRSPVAPEVQAEVRRLFRWLVANMPKNVPADLRALMSRLGRNPPDAPEPAARQIPATARAFTSTVIRVPLATWQAPRTKTPTPIR